MDANIWDVPNLYIGDAGKILELLSYVEDRSDGSATISSYLPS